MTLESEEASKLQKRVHFDLGGTSKPTSNSEVLQKSDKILSESTSASKQGFLKGRLGLVFNEKLDKKRCVSLLR